MNHHKYSLGSNDTVIAMRARSTFGTRSSSPAVNAIKVAAAATAFGPSHSTSPAHTSSSSNGLPLNANGGHATHCAIASTSGSAGIWSTTIEEASSSSSPSSTNNIKNFGQSHSSCCYHCPKYNNSTTATATTATEDISQYNNKNPDNSIVMINGSSGGIQTIEDQIRAVDKVIKECDNSRKNLEQISRRLDDLNDEVKRYREFLGHEKSHRDPTVYKTVNSEPPSPYNDNICGIMSSLTFQLTKEWSGKLNMISTALHSQTPSTPGSKMSDRN
uniref:Uncharacterized protein n=1 Tax=Panagrolaimus sp. PS1159 TaxID=55785 RepID=A0AC35FHS6_9BILA